MCCDAIHTPNHDVATSIYNVMSTVERTMYTSTVYAERITWLTTVTANDTVQANLDVVDSYLLAWIG